MTNVEIAQIFNTIADLLELQEANPFRVRAYRAAGLSVQSQGEEMKTLYEKGGAKALKQITGIGDDLAQKIEEMIKTQKCAYLGELKKKIPPGLLKIMKIEGLGPKKTRELWKKFRVVNVDYLKRLCQSGKLANYKGWGEKTAQNILRGIELAKKYGERLPIGDVVGSVNTILTSLKKTNLASKIDIAGSFRRGKETVGDLDFVAASTDPKKLIEAFANLPQVKEVEVKGPTKCTVFLDIGIDADLRVVKPWEYGAALYYSTGSQAHNVAVRGRALKMGLTINEYGIFRGTKTRKGKCIASRTEKEMFDALTLPFIPPELRENSGELDGLPKNLIELKYIQGDMHLHTTFSDGMNSAVEMIKAAKEKGYRYIAITDHASALGIVKGIKEENVSQYRRMIEAAAKKVGGITVLVGSEVDIMPDGSLYLSDNALKKLDWVVASVHTSFRQGRAEMTKRILRALANPYVHVLGHPTGRQLGHREPIDFDFERVLEAAKKYRVLMEVNASWGRLDLNDAHCRAAQDADAMMIINSDSHHAGEFDLTFGVQQAQRGWVEKKLVFNTRPVEKVKQWLTSK